MQKVLFGLLPVTAGARVLHDRGATFPLASGTKPIDRAPYRANPRLRDVIGKCVNEMEKDGIIEQRDRPCGSAVTVVAKSDGIASFYVDYRSKLDESLARTS